MKENLPYSIAFIIGLIIVAILTWLETPGFLAISISATLATAIAWFIEKYKAQENQIDSQPYC